MQTSERSFEVERTQTGILPDFRKFGNQRNACDLRPRIEPQHEKNILQEAYDHFHFTLTGFL